MRIGRAAAAYFALTFAAGFVLGFARVLWLAPRVGTRAAELLEAPIMLMVTLLAARWVVGRFRLRTACVSDLLAVGGVALVLLLLCELAVVLWVQGSTIRAYVAGRDPVAGTVYVVMLMFFAGMPALVARRRRPAASHG